jgi:hypothetical protein
MEDQDVNEVTPSEVTETATEIAVEPEVKAGDKTEPNLLLKSLKEEREKRRILEAELEKANLEKQDVITEAFSDEGKLLEKQIKVLNETIALKDLSLTYPAITDKRSEFDEFRKDYPGISLDKVAKLFLVENDLLESPKPRMGLEKSTGGGRTAPQTGMTLKEFDGLRTSNFRKYKQILQSGKAPKE